MSDMSVQRLISITLLDYGYPYWKCALDAKQYSITKKHILVGMVI